MLLKTSIARKKDMGDVIALLRANPGEISAVELQKLCDQFGTPA